jgi:hypoxanthine-DNA glycosylase
MPHRSRRRALPWAPPPLRHGLPAIEPPRARTLILGSFPSEASLAAGRYYAHARNRFWHTVGAVLEAGETATYADLTGVLRSAEIALWDVLAHCARPGSLDSAIIRGSEEPNDLGAFVERHPGLRAIAFNGRAAAALFDRLVIPLDLLRASDIAVHVLPSTSPANAAVGADALLAAWSAALGT